MYRYLVLLATLVPSAIGTTVTTVTSRFSVDMTDVDDDINKVRLWVTDYDNSVHYRDAIDRQGNTNIWSKSVTNIPKNKEILFTFSYEHGTPDSEIWKYERDLVSSVVFEKRSSVTNKVFSKLENGDCDSTYFYEESTGSKFRLIEIAETDTAYNAVWGGCASGSPCAYPNEYKIDSSMYSTTCAECDNPVSKVENNNCVACVSGYFNIDTKECLDDVVSSCPTESEVLNSITDAEVLAQRYKNVRVSQACS